MKAWDSMYYKSYGATMKGYVLVPDELLADANQIAHLLDESFDYVMSLPPK